MSEVAKGKKRTPESIQKTVDGTSKEWKFADPEGKIVVFKNLKKFCRDNNLNMSCMRGVCSGSQTEHKGWRLPLPENEKEFVPVWRRWKEYELINSSGEKVKIQNLSKFCRENGLTRKRINAVITGKKKEYQGWKKAD